MSEFEKDPFPEASVPQETGAEPGTSPAAAAPPAAPAPAQPIAPAAAQAAVPAEAAPEPPPRPSVPPSDAPTVPMIPVEKLRFQTAPAGASEPVRAPRPQSETAAAAPAAAASAEPELRAPAPPVAPLRPAGPASADPGPAAAIPPAPAPVPGAARDLTDRRQPLYRECRGYRLRLDPPDLARLRELPGSRGKSDDEIGEAFFDGQADRLAASIAGDVPTPSEIRVVVDPYSRQAFLALENRIRGILSF